MLGFVRKSESLQLCWELLFWHSCAYICVAWFNKPKTNVGWAQFLYLCFSTANLSHFTYFFNGKMETQKLMNRVFSNVNLSSPLKRQKAVYPPPTGCFPQSSLHFDSCPSRHWEVLKCCFLGDALLSQYTLFVFTSTYLQRDFSRWHMLLVAFSFASKYAAMARTGTRAISFCSTKTSAEVKVMKQELCKRQIASESKEGPSRLVRQAHTPAPFAEIPKGAGFLFALPGLPNPRSLLQSAPFPSCRCPPFSPYP